MPPSENACPLPGQSLLEALPDSTVLISMDGEIRWMNRAAIDRLGLPDEDWIGRSCIDLIHPDDLQSVLLALSSVQGKVRGTPIEVRIRTAAGWLLAEVVGAPLGDDSGHIIIAMRDLTERRRWEVAGDETAKLRALVHHAPTLFILLDSDGVVQSTSGAVTRLLGHDQADLENESVELLVATGDRDRLRSAIARAVSNTPAQVAPESVEVRLIDRRTDREVPYELTIVNLLDDPTVGGLVVAGHDVSERSAAEDGLRDTLSLLHATLDSTADGIHVVDLKGRTTSFNARFLAMWDVPTEVVKSDDPERMLAHGARMLRDPERFNQRIQTVFADSEADSFDLIEFRDGRVYERYSTPQRVDGTVVGRVWSFHDVTRQKQLERELEHQAFHDPLTGLANQALFRDRVEHALELSARTGDHVALLYFDLDDFKGVNDSLGHPVGDQLLIAVTRRLADCLRTNDTIARLGGDEFAVLVENAGDRDAVSALANRLMDAFHDPLHVGSRELVTSISLGIAFGEPGVDAEQLLRNADLAMYAAKRGGKRHFKLYESEMHAAALDKLETEADLRVAVARDELWLAYQPIVELETSRIEGVEALIRWQHPQRGVVGPDSFIGAAEDSGLIDQIGDFVLQDACARMQQWTRAGGTSGLTLAVNVSSRQLTGDRIVRQVHDALDRSGLAPSRLMLELTETAMVSDSGTARRTLDDLKSLGVRLALDDFGTGFSSLTHLQQFPIDVIKIDRSFMTPDDENASLVRAVLRMSQELGLEAIAEGVETAEQVAFLLDAGATLGQGHFFGRPARPEFLDRWVGSAGRASLS